MLALCNLKQNTWLCSKQSSFTTRSLQPLRSRNPLKCFMQHILWAHLYGAPPTSKHQFVFDVLASGQSYKGFTIVNYDSRVVPDWKIPHIMTLES